MSQRFIQGRGCSLQLENVLGQSSVHKFFLVCGKSLDRQPVWESIQKASMPFVRFDAFSSNPLYEDVEKGVALFRKEHCDCVVAIGGGSTTDVAKCIKLFSSMDEGNGPYLLQQSKTNDIPLVAMPTTSGTGSESTHFAVVYCHGEKQSVSHESLLPSIVFLDPQFLETLPLYQKKCTMLDALCQAIESWWSIRSNEESITWSKKAIPLILDNIDGYLENEEQSNANMLLAANYAGRAINITTTTAPHAMSYKLTSLFHIPHGHAVAICLPEVWGYMNTHLMDCVDTRGTRYVECTFREIATVLRADSIEDAISWFHRMLTRLNITNPTCCDGAVIGSLGESVNLQRLKNNPILLSKQALLHLYQIVLWPKEGNI